MLMKNQSLFLPQHSMKCVMCSIMLKICGSNEGKLYRFEGFHSLDK